MCLDLPRIARKNRSSVLLQAFAVANKKYTNHVILHPSMPYNAVICGPSLQVHFSGQSGKLRQIAANHSLQSQSNRSKNQVVLLPSAKCGKSWQTVVLRTSKSGVLLSSKIMPSRQINTQRQRCTLCCISRRSVTADGFSLPQYGPDQGHSYI